MLRTNSLYIKRKKDYKLFNKVNLYNSFACIVISRT